MKVRIQKWGDSLAIRIPNVYAYEAKINEDTEVDFSLVWGKLMITPLPPREYNLEKMLRAVTPENVHGESDMGATRGGESS
jgi:antitoxin MazE